MRATLVVNPKATGTTARMRDVLAHALHADLKVEVATTEGRGHATQIAADAASDGVDYVVALGGDGTVNEVVNGLLAGGPVPDLPALGIVPGGCANVLARSLGLPTDPVEATAVLLEAVRDGDTQQIGLGHTAWHGEPDPNSPARSGGPAGPRERWFTFCSGLGIDAATVARVEQARKPGTRVTTYRYARAALNEYFLHMSHRTPQLTLQLPGHPDTDVFLGLVCNTSPWTYLGDRPVTPCPQASFDRGLDVFGLTRMRPLPTLRILAQLFGAGPHGRRVVGAHDLPEVTIRAADLLPLQVDGDFLGRTSACTMRSVPHALRVVTGAPTPS